MTNQEIANAYAKYMSEGKNWKQAVQGLMAQGVDIDESFSVIFHAFLEHENKTAPSTNLSADK